MASEKRLIDMGNFLEVLRRYLNSSPVRKSGPVCCGMRIAIRSCIELLESQKPVDAVEVVRCKDCKGWCAEEIAKQYGVDRYCTMTMIPTNADDFCSLGERVDGD